MALSESQAMTVRGKEHFYARLQGYSCSGVPLRNASNEIIGVASLSSIDRGSAGDSLFAQQLLGAAASRIQETLFLRDFKDAAIVSVAVPGRRELIKGAELVAVDERGTILGATSAAHKLTDVDAHSDLTGRAFDQVFGTDLGSLDRVPGRVMSVRRDKGPLLELWTRTLMESTKAFPGFRKQKEISNRRNLPSTFKELVAGSQVLAAICERAKTSFDHSIPVLIEGETGTGKSALIKVLVGNARSLTVDCAALSGADDDRDYIRSLIEQARIAGGLEQGTTLIFDNVDEMPSFAQDMFRCLLEETEAAADQAIRILSTSRKPLREAVTNGSFRDDFYYLLSGMSVVLPPVRERESPEILARAVAESIGTSNANFDKGALKAIRHYDWPGNVREMRNVLRQAVLHGDGQSISALDLAIAQPNGSPARKLAKLHVCDEEQIILDALRSASWNVSRAARTLGMGRATIHRKMNGFGISRPT